MLSRPHLFLRLTAQLHLSTCNLSRAAPLYHRPLSPALLLRAMSSTSSSSYPTIALTDNEARLAQLLVECADWVDAHPEEVDKLRLKDEQGNWIGKLRGEEQIELRIAGGWVRDKLLGLQSDDIDVSTSPDPITGLKFATLFETYLHTVGKQDLMGKLTKIEAKPEQSKHLETATAMVCDLSVDWVQQRGQEVYTEGSRIPTVAFGTPLEDAERRDLTINALFYNLRTRSIEDQTGKGLEDLGLVPGKTKRIRTPLEPFRTFHDDPLRVVRAVRFAARFGREFELNADLVEAIGKEEIRAALRDPKKISRERVGMELEKMLLGRDPLLALELIDQLNLHPLVFLYDAHDVEAALDPSASPPPPPLPHLSLQSAQIVSAFLNPPPSSSLPPLHPLLRFSRVPIDPTLPTSQQVYPPSLTELYPHNVKRLYLACGLLPLHDLPAIDKKKTVWVGEKVVRDGIKWPTMDNVWAKKAQDASGLLSEGVQRFAAEGVTENEADRADMGLLLRNVAVHDMHLARWNVSLFWSLVVDAVRVSGDLAQTTALINTYSRFIDRALGYSLDTRAFEPPLLDGKTVNDLLPQTKGSPAMVAILQLVIHFQLSHPDATAEDCKAYLAGPALDQVEEALRKFVKKPAVKKQKQQKQ